jgi:hypothetical protein
MVQSCYVRISLFSYVLFAAVGQERLAVRVSEQGQACSVLHKQGLVILLVAVAMYVCTSVA